jgi:hypothetical protein
MSAVSAPSRPTQPRLFDDALPAGVLAHCVFPYLYYQEMMGAIRTCTKFAAAEKIPSPVGREILVNRLVPASDQVTSVTALYNGQHCFSHQMKILLDRFPRTTHIDLSRITVLAPVLNELREWMAGKQITALALPEQHSFDTVGFGDKAFDLLNSLNTECLTSLNIRSLDYLPTLDRNTDPLITFYRQKLPQFRGLAKFIPPTKQDRNAQLEYVLRLPMGVENLFLNIMSKQTATALARRMNPRLTRFQINGIAAEKTDPAIQEFFAALIPKLRTIRECTICLRWMVRQPAIEGEAPEQSWIEGITQQVGQNRDLEVFILHATFVPGALPPLLRVLQAAPYLRKCLIVVENKLTDDDKSTVEQIKRESRHISIFQKA